jgi:hypothetical protein
MAMIPSRLKPPRLSDSSEAAHSAGGPRSAKSLAIFAYSWMNLSCRPFPSVLYDL